MYSFMTHSNVGNVGLDLLDTKVPKVYKSTIGVPYDISDGCDFKRTGWSNSHATHSWHMFCLFKNKLYLNQKTKKQCYVKCWKCPLRSTMHSLFSSYLMQPCEDFLKWRLKCTAKYFVLILPKCMGCFSKRSHSKTRKNRNPGIKVATSFEK
jgi:hypothetical protein